MAAPLAGGFEAGARRTVAVEDIAAELAALWAVSEGEPEAATTRACVLNLIAVAEGDAHELDQRMASFPELVTELTAEHPSRVFQVLAAPAAAEDSLQADVSAHCHLRSGGKRQVCCEQITLRATGAPVEHLHATIAPLILGDLPTFLWLWDAPPFGSHRFERLARLADCLVVDTAHVADSLEVLAGLAQWSRSGEGAALGTAPGDLNWRRLWAWRERLAALFDPPERRRALEDVQSVEVRLPRAEAGAAARAVYLVGWLAGRLGWQVRPATARKKRGGLRVELDAGTHAVRVKLAEARDGAGFAVRLEAGGEAEMLVASVESAGGSSPSRAASAHTLSRIERSGREVWSRRDALPETSTAHLLMRELELGSRDRVYDEALTVAGDLARLWRDAKGP